MLFIKVILLIVNCVEFDKWFIFFLEMNVGVFLLFIILGDRNNLILLINLFLKRLLLRVVLFLIRIELMFNFFNLYIINFKFIKLFFEGEIIVLILFFFNIDNFIFFL